MTAPKEILQLVDRFKEQREAYLSPHYNEAQLRQEFLNPFFEALGWDIHNKRGYAEAYKEVVHEASVKVGIETKAPDYSFRIGGTRKFFVEAKKPSVKIYEDPAPAFQLRRYAWSAKLPLSILSNFAEFTVYDCRVKPFQSDKAAMSRTLYLTVDDYADRWDEIAGIFSCEAINKGSFDKYAVGKGKKGTAEVDSAFLEEIESWRDALARNIALRNSGLNQAELNFAVQQTIDRIIFLRICEDRGIESYGRLRGLLNGSNVYPRLRQLFHDADDRYNSGLFHFRRESGRGEPDNLTLGLEIEDKVLKEILENIYYPESPYEFSVLPADILGQVYEQFLGKVIRLTAGGHAKVEDKPEVKKAGGVYYTPTYIVEYIVKNMVGKLVEGKKPEKVADLKILDPACGSGSFLIGAYQYLLDWYLHWYSENEPEKHAKGRSPRIFKGQGNVWRLTTAERKRILLNNIYGVDIDPQAVEVTKLSLLLKVLEDESAETLGRNWEMFHERALPDLDSNIKCGNSLIGPDFYEGKLDLDTEERRRINAFDWQAELTEVFKAGGFDAVIGNPPYVRIQTMKEWAPLEVEFYKQRYQAASKGNYDIYVVFVERGLELLNKKGLLGFILPHKFFNAEYGEPLRGLIAQGKHLAHVVHFGDQQVFDGATTYTTLLFLSKAANNSFDLVRVNDLQNWRTGEVQTRGSVQAEAVTATEWNFTVGKGAALFERLSRMPVKLADVADRIYQGPITSADNIFLFKDYRNENRKTIEVLSKELQEWVKLETPILKSVIRSGSIGRYSATPTAYVLFPYSVRNNTAMLLSQTELQKFYPLTWIYLERNKKLLEIREKGVFKDAEWYRFGRTQNLGMWERPKLLVPYMITELSAYLDSTDNFYFVNVTTGGYGIISNESRGSYAYLCGLLNSRLLNFYLKQVSTTFHGGYFAANKQYIEQLPIQPINFSDKADRSCHDKMVKLVEEILSLHKKLAAAKTPHEKTALQRQIDAADKQIDQLVYELYDLTEGEIKIVEGNA